MPLTWSNPHELAEALDKAHPDADRLNLSEADVVTMVRALPGFLDSSHPTAEDAQNVLMAWVQLDGDDESPVAAGEID